MKEDMLKSNEKLPMKTQNFNGVKLKANGNK